MKTFSHHCNQEKRLSYCERNPTPPLWVELHTLYLPAGKRTAFLRRNHSLDSKTSIQDGVSEVSGISPWTQNTGIAVKGNSKVAPTWAEPLRACHAGWQLRSHPQGHRGRFPIPFASLVYCAACPYSWSTQALNWDTQLTLPKRHQQNKENIFNFP